jgi:hypothetical protein
LALTTRQRWLVDPAEGDPRFPRQPLVATSLFPFAKTFHLTLPNERTGQVSISDGSCRQRNLILNPNRQNQRNQLACMCCSGSVLFNQNGNRWKAFCNDAGDNSETGVCPN